MAEFVPFNFKVHLYNESNNEMLCQGLFSEVQGLEVTMEPRAIQAGGQSNTYDMDVRLNIRDVARTFLYNSDVGDESMEPQRCLFVWGSFLFVGIMESLEETVEFFSPEGVPLRATVALKLNESRFIYGNRDAEATHADEMVQQYRTLVPRAWRPACIVRHQLPMLTVLCAPYIIEIVRRINKAFLTAQQV